METRDQSNDQFSHRLLILRLLLVVLRLFLVQMTHRGESSDRQCIFNAAHLTGEQEKRS